MTKNNNTEHAKPCLKRWWRQVSFIPFLHSKWLTDTVKSNLSAKVTEAELGHRGEVFLVIENHLPIKTAYHQGCRGRAIDLFSQYRVWDTEENTGVLVYINICERNLHIIADRGINQHVAPDTWQNLCDKAVTGIKEGQHETSLNELLTEIGQLLRQYYNLEHDPQGNELSDSIVHLK